MEKVYILVEETEDGKTILNVYNKKKNAVKEMNAYIEKAKIEMKSDEEPIEAKTEVSYYVSNGMGRFFFYQVMEIILKD